MTITNEINNDLIIFGAHILLEEKKQEEFVTADLLYSMSSKITGRWF